MFPCGVEYEVLLPSRETLADRCAVLRGMLNVDPTDAAGTYEIVVKIMEEWMCMDMTRNWCVLKRSRGEHERAFVRPLASDAGAVVRRHPLQVPYSSPGANFGIDAGGDAEHPPRSAEQREEDKLWIVNSCLATILVDPHYPTQKATWNAVSGFVQEWQGRLEAKRLRQGRSPRLVSSVDVALVAGSTQDLYTAADRASSGPGSSSCSQNRVSSTAHRDSVRRSRSRSR
jgi:hypothetical protein